jgi:hypothetical protein
MAHFPVSLKFGQTPFTTSGRGLDNDEAVISHGQAVSCVSWMRRITCATRTISLLSAKR